MTTMYSLIIPCYNEERLLPQTLSAVKTAMDSIRHPGELIVVDNNSNDRTGDIGRRFGAKVVFEPINQISRARNAGAKAAAGRYLIFLDADTLLPGKLLERALDHLMSGQCCGGGARVTFIEPLPKIPEKTLGVWNWLSRRFKWAAGSFVYCLKEGFIAVGGFSEAVYASEEIWFSIGMRSWGKKKGLDFKIIDDPPVQTSSRKIEWFSGLEIFVSILIIFLFPFWMRYKSLTYFWYRRPK